MSLPPSRIGDHGQRFEVVYHDDLDRQRCFGWSETVPGAFAMVRSINLNPSMRLPMILDRQENAPLYEVTCVGADGERRVYGSATDMLAAGDMIEAVVATEGLRLPQMRVVRAVEEPAA